MPPPQPLPWWQPWLLPERPGSRCAAPTLLALVLPLVVVAAMPAWLVPATIASVTLGCGLGLAWLLLLGPRWFREAPATALLVLGLAFASAANLELGPRLEAALRARELVVRLQVWRVDRQTPGTPAPLPTYHTGTAVGRLAEVADATGNGVLVYTADALQRWSVGGWKDACYVLLRADGRGEIVRNRATLDTALGER